MQMVFDICPRELSEDYPFAEKTLEYNQQNNWEKLKKNFAQI